MQPMSALLRLSWINTLLSGHIFFPPHVNRIISSEFHADDVKRRHRDGDSVPSLQIRTKSYCRDISAYKMHPLYRNDGKNGGPTCRLLYGHVALKWFCSVSDKYSLIIGLRRESRRLNTALWNSSTPSNNIAAYCRIVASFFVFFRSVSI